MPTEADAQSMQFFDTLAEHTISLLTRALHQATDAIFLLDEEARLLYANHAACRTLGYTIHELPKLSFTQIAPDWHTYFGAATDRPASDARFELTCHCKDGSRFPAEIQTSRLEWASTRCTLVMAREIAERKRFEREQANSHARLRELAAQHEIAREQEKKWLAHELHDQLGQMLASLKLGIATLEMQLEKGESHLSERLQSLTALSARCMQVVRDLAEGLRPTLLNMGIAAALEQLASDFQTRRRVPCIVTPPATAIECDEARATALFRLVQEILANIAHSTELSRVEMVLDHLDGECVVEIRADHSRALHPIALLEEFQWRAMRERLHTLGGTLSVADSQQKIVVTVRLPERTRLERRGRWISKRPRLGVPQCALPRRNR